MHETVPEGCGKGLQRDRIVSVSPVCVEGQRFRS